MKEKNTNEKKNFNKFIIFFRIISILIIIFCLVYIYLWYMENKKSSEILTTITDSSVIDTIVIQIPSDSNSTTDNINNNTITSDTNSNNSSSSTEITAYKLDFNNLLKSNSSTVGWLNVPNTNINYPVVQANDNSFYLSHSFNKSSNKAGWIFADYRNKFDGNDKNIIIYGHNRMDSSMFATLKNTQKNYWLNNKNNHYITFTTPTQTYVYEVFSVYTIKSETYYLTTFFEDDDTYSKFLNTLKSRSIYDFGVNVDSDDSILTLSTCDATGKSRVILHGKRIL